MIVGIGGSGRKIGNSARLLKEVLSAAERHSGEVCTSHGLGDLAFRGCVGCGACRATADSCVLRDDLTAVLAAVADADAVALAAPVYYGYTSGLFKSFLDRWYSFRDGQRRLRTRAGRPALLILTQGHPDPSTYAWTVESLRKTLSAYGFEPSLWVAAGLGGPQDADGARELLAEAARRGACLAAQARPGPGGAP